MYRNRLWWITKCLVLCLAGIFIAGQLSDLLNPLIWWALHQNGATLLQRPIFINTYYLPLIGAYGFAMGLIPLHHLKALLVACFAKFQSRSHPQPEEMSFSRPMMWAWAPILLVLAVRFLTFRTVADHSVLAATTYGESRYEHFFAPFSVFSAVDPAAWIFDRFLLTGPTLFLLAYTVAVWMRHQYPTHPTVSGECPTTPSDDVE